MDLSQRFRLADSPGRGVSCSEQGLFVGDTPLLERDANPPNAGDWRPRRLEDVNRDLSTSYGLPTDFTTKMAGVSAICRSLNDGKIAHAQLVALFMRLPDAAELKKGASPADLASRLRASGLLKILWNPGDHPRWPAGTRCARDTERKNVHGRTEEP